jgi:uncharacterized protein (TIGR00290 family)
VKVNRMEKVLVSWSSGKDSALMLHEIQKSSQYHVAALLTTITQDYQRVSMHGVRVGLLDQQAKALGIPLEKVFISSQATNAEYETAMQKLLRKYQGQGIAKVVFGDIFLEDVRQYREHNLAKIGMQAVFPLWQRDTRQLAEELLHRGFRALVTCVDGQALDGNFAGRLIDQDFFADLPPGIDPCGENGEFHSFAFDGPIFNQPVDFIPGETVLRDERFYFHDLIPLTIRAIPVEQTYSLRREILRPGYPPQLSEYPLDEHPDTWHAGAFLDGKQVGVATLLHEPPPGEDNSQSWRLRGMAVHKDARHKGIGKALVKACVSYVTARQGQEIWCNGRVTALSFYQALGFEIVGEPFDVPESGPHYQMRRTLV